MSIQSSSASLCEFKSPSLASREPEANSLSLKLDSTILAENGFGRIVSLTSSALIPVKCGSGNRERLTQSRVEVKLVSAFASES